MAGMLFPKSWITTEPFFLLLFPVSPPIEDNELEKDIIFATVLCNLRRTASLA